MNAAPRHSWGGSSAAILVPLDVLLALLVLLLRLGARWRWVLPLLAILAALLVLLRR
jgi:hypothetical protein